MITDPTSHPTDTIGWQFLQQIDLTARAVEHVAYHMRIITHLLANSDHRHLTSYSQDLDAAVVALKPVDDSLRSIASSAAAAWGITAGTSLPAIAASAPEELQAPLREALDGLGAVTRELQEDGAIASEVLEAALQIVSRRCREVEAATSDPRYRPAPLIRS